MPEGDTVHLAARRLDDALSGHRLTRTDFRVPQHATADLSGQTLVTTVARGKHLLTRTDAGVTLHTHLKMDGEWRLFRAGERWRRPDGGRPGLRRPEGPGHQVRVVLETAPWVAVGHLLGIVELLPTEREADVVGHLGPDVLGPDWDPERAVANLGRDPARAIGEALVDQRLIAGPGNVYKSEALFLRGIHPWTAAGEVDVTALVDLVKRLMEANRDTGRQVTTGDLRRGQGRWVYARDACRRCGTPIERGVQGEAPRERVTYWCPSCQRR
jgi:endonuclease-8